MKVSVIMPVKNEEKSIVEVLRSLLDQTRAPDEIIITDGGSTDRTIELINRFIEEGAPIRLFREKEALPGKGRNVAIANASFDIIALTDAGTILTGNWLKSLIEPLDASPDTQIVYGVQGYYAKTFFEKCFVVVYRPPGKAYNGKMLYYPYMGSLLIKKEVWKKTGGIREDLRAAEDLLFFQKIRLEKFRSTVMPEAIAYWRPRSNFKETFIMGYTYSECDALAGMHGSNYVKKFLRYALGTCLLTVGFHHHIYYGLLIAGILLISAVICRKNWKEFINTAIRNPFAYFMVIAIMVSLDVSSMAGYLKGLLSKRSSLTKLTGMPKLTKIL
ncbi:MAG: glycosyltransferase [Candidatus Omnitrophota bacterium]|jgi:glycosyltransferase involved in cell wall biosynthesis